MLEWVGNKSQQLFGLTWGSYQIHEQAVSLEVMREKQNKTLESDITSMPISKIPVSEHFPISKEHSHLHIILLNLTT